MKADLKTNGDIVLVAESDDEKERLEKWADKNFTVNESDVGAYMNIVIKL